MKEYRNPIKRNFSICRERRKTAGYGGGSRIISYRLFQDVCYKMTFRYRNDILSYSLKIFFFNNSLFYLIIDYFYILFCLHVRWFTSI